MHASRRLAIFAAVVALALVAAFALPSLTADQQDQAAAPAVAPQQPVATDDEQDAEAEWLVWYREALEQAQETGRPVLALFTGSDWCPPCILQDREVFEQPEFQQWAEEQVVLLELDFPRQKEQPEDLKRQNQALVEEYGVRGFPTVLILTVEGNEVERYVSYQRGMGPEQWIERTQEAVDEARGDEEDDD